MNKQELINDALIVNSSTRQAVYKAFNYSFDFDLIDSALSIIDENFDEDKKSYDYEIDELHYYADITEYYVKNSHEVDQKISQEGATSVAMAVAMARSDEMHGVIANILEVIDDLVEDEQEEGLTA